MKIVEVGTVKTAKDGRQFFVIRFRPSLGQRPVSRTFWEQYKRDSKTQELTQEKYWERISPKEALEALKAGEFIDGRKVTHTVEPYMLGERSVTVYSTIVFPDEIEEVVFVNQNHVIVDPETGEALGELRPKPKAVLAPDGELDPNAPAGDKEEEEEEEEDDKNTETSGGQQPRGSQKNK